MYRKLLPVPALLLIAVIIVSGMGLISASAITSNCVTFTQEQTHSSDIYYDRLPCFYLTINNPTADSHRVTATYEISDDSNNTVHTDTISIDVPGGDKLIRSYTPQMTMNYGIYTIKATLTGLFKTMTYYDEFSIVPSPKSINDKVGINRNFMSSRLGKDKTEKHLPEAGIGWVRESIEWSEVEKGTKDPDTGEVISTLQVPEYYDSMIDSLRANGTKVLLILCYGNTLYEDGVLPKTEDGIKAFANYCAFIAEHFKGRVDAFEIWNEPNLEQFAGRADCTGTEYANLLMAAYDAIDAVNKEAIIIGGSFNSMKIEDTLKFYEEMMNVDGIKNHMDAISFHPYHSDGRYSDESATSFLEDLASVKATLVSAGAAEMPIWLTEFGSSSWYDANDSTASVQGYTEERQAANLVRMGIMARTDSQIEKLFYYNIVDLRASTAKESKYGLMDLHRNAKPAYLTVAFMNSLLANSEYVQTFTDAGSLKASFTGYQFSGDKDVFVLWGNELNGLASEPDIQVAYDCSADNKPYATYSTWRSVTLHVYEGAKVTLYDMYGNETTDVNIGLNPVYAVCSYTKPYSSVVKMNAQNGVLTVSGCNANPGASVTLTAKCEGALEYIDQTVANSLGEYSFDMAYDSKCVYDIRVYDSASALNASYGEVDYRSTITYYINDTEVTLSNIADAKTGDRVKAVVEVTPFKEGASLGNLLAAGVAYGDGCSMLHVNTDNTGNFTGDTALLTTEFTITDVSQIKDIKFFIWDERLTPLRRSTEIKVN